VVRGQRTLNVTRFPADFDGVWPAAPPVPLLRRLGVRTASEIEAERYALKAVRGDFSGGPTESGGTALERAQHVVDAVRGHKDEKLH